MLWFNVRSLVVVPAEKSPTNKLLVGVSVNGGIAAFASSFGTALAISKPSLPKART